MFINLYLFFAFGSFVDSAPAGGSCHVIIAKPVLLVHWCRKHWCRKQWRTTIYAGICGEDPGLFVSSVAVYKAVPVADSGCRRWALAHFCSCNDVRQEWVYKRYVIHVPITCTYVTLHVHVVCVWGGGGLNCFIMGWLKFSASRSYFVLVYLPTLPHEGCCQWQFTQIEMFCLCECLRSMVLNSACGWDVSFVHVGIQSFTFQFGLPKPGQGNLLISVDTYACIIAVGLSATAFSFTSCATLVAFLFTTEPTVTLLFILLKRTKWKLNGSVHRWLQCWHGDSLWQSRTPQTARLSSTNMFEVRTYSARAKTSDSMWSSLLQTMHRTTDKWKVQLS